MGTHSDALKPSGRATGEAMGLHRELVRRHPLAVYVALTFTISWGGILVLAIPGGIPGRPDEVARLFPLALAALFAGPSVAGVSLTALADGRTGLGSLLIRLTRWRVGGRWWAVALLTGPVLVAAVIFGLSLRSPVFLPGILTTDDRVGLVVMALGWGLLGGGLLEELGWTGFAVPSLRQHHGILTTGLIVGLLWGIWHLPIAFWASRAMAGEGSLAAFIAGFLTFYLVALPAYRVLMVWLYDRTGSLLLAAVMHAVLSASTIILQPLPEAGQFTWNAVLAASLWGLVVIGTRITPRRPAAPASRPR